MRLYILINACSSAIESASRSDMSGNTDWFEKDIPDETAEILLNGNSRDEHGSALYKWENGTVVEITIEERQKEWGSDEEGQDIEQRMTKAEGNIADLNTSLDIILEGRME